MIEAAEPHALVFTPGASLALVVRDREAAWALVRALAARQIGIAADGVRIATAARGKPFLAHDTAFSFNVSHAGSCSLVAVSLAGAVGCDAEGRFLADDAERLGPEVLHASERRALVGLDAHARHRAFMRCWVRKEAVLKALGSGFAEDPRAIAVGVAARPAAPHGLHLHDGPEVGGCMLAVASADAACRWHAVRG